jgi:IS4 transposase
VHGAFDLPTERFGFFELTEETGGETLDRAPVAPGEIRIGDRAYLQPDRIAEVIGAGVDVVVRAGWRGARWLDQECGPADLLAMLAEGDAAGLIDRPIKIGRRSGKPPLSLRLVAVKKSPGAAAEARRKAKLASRKGGHQLAKETLAAADWVILVASLDPDKFSAHDVLALYRLRWRIELGFKRLKSLIGLKGPPGKDPRSARPWVLAHLLLILLLEPLLDELEGSPPKASAA